MHGGEEALSLRVLSDSELAKFEHHPLGLSREQLGTAFSPALQALPSLVVAQQATTRQLMEVTINGNLIRAADGNGFRAFAMDGSGISSQARLHEANALQSLTVGAALWQLASVAVAQKHLADINETLKRLEGKLDLVFEFLKQERASRVEAALRYVHSTLIAAQAGEFLPHHRQELESVSRELSGIYIHLRNELDSRVTAPLERSKAGSEAEFNSVVEKIHDLGQLFEQVDFCLNVRLVCSYTASLFPGRDRALEQQMDAVVEDSREMARLRMKVEKKLDEDIARIDAFFNLEATLKKRRDEAKAKAAAVKSQFNQSSRNRLEKARQAKAMLGEYRQTRRLCVEVVDGVAIGATEMLVPLEARA